MQAACDKICVLFANKMFASSVLAYTSSAATVLPRGRGLNWPFARNVCWP